MSNTPCKKKCPEGGIDARFSIGPRKKVFFSKGNLQYQPSTGHWRFAERQYEFLGVDSDKIKSKRKGWMDMFGWGTGDNPTLNGDFGDYVDFKDWGENAIINGGDEPGLWRTLDIEEWGYLLYERKTKSGISFAKAKVNDVDGLIILPDNWKEETFDFNNVNDKGGHFEDNNISVSQWEDLEKEGSVFLPVVESEAGNSVHEYWSSSGIPEYGWSIVIFSDIFEQDLEPFFGVFVRLVSAK